MIIVSCLKKPVVIIAIITAFCFSAQAQKADTITVAKELQTLYDVQLLPAYRSNTISAQTSTYDTTGNNDDGFNGYYSFVRRNQDSSLVIFDVKGAGAINRIWTATVTEDTLDFYIDDTLKPALSINYMDLFSGKVLPFAMPLCGNQLGGYYCYYPILFQKRCVIVCRGKTIQFHQLQYRLYQPGTVVQPFAKNPDVTTQAALQKVKTLWQASTKNATDFVTNEAALQTIETTVVLKPGTTKPIAVITSGGRITGIEISPANAFENLCKNVDIRVFWDGETEPAINCPVADFFGYGFGKCSMQGLLIGSAANTNYCYIPMPFAKQARVELVYRTAPDTVLQPLQVTAKIYYTKQPLQPQLEGKLYTQYHVGKTVAGKPHVFADIKGKGHYIGTLLQAQGLQPGMTIFFEGDDSTVIDGQMKLHGTGSEDYFNGGWYALLDRWDTKMSLPLHGALDYSLLFTRTGGYRFYMSDVLSFENSFYHTIEHGPEQNNAPAIYTSVSFYYCNKPPVKMIAPANTDTRVYIPDTLNVFPQFTKIVVGDDMSITTTWDSAAIGQSFAIKANNNSKLKVSLEDVPPGEYKVFMNYTLQKSGCKFSLWQRQSQLTDWINTSAMESKNEAESYLCNITVTELNNAITLRFTTTEELNNFLFSKLMLVKVK